MSYLLIGGGLASANCARWLREEGAEGEVLVVGASPTRRTTGRSAPRAICGGERRARSTFFRPHEWWAEQEVELLTRTSVTASTSSARTAALSNKEQVQFEQALLATGANVRRLNVSGCELEQIHYLRTLGNADAIRDGVATPRRSS